MKPKYLEFSGINSFARKAEIDFEKLLSGGIFGIFGDTGSGKTTILDSMIFALYGRIDRIKGGVGNEIINYNCDRAYVRFDFETETPQGRKVYRVEREIKLPSLEEARACLDSCTPPAGEKLLRTLRFGRNVKFLLEDGWALLRLSGTEPAVRIFAELPTKARAERAAEALKSCLAAAGRGCAV